MEALQIFFLMLCLKLSLTDRQYSDYIDDISQNEIRYQPGGDFTLPNFYRPVPRTTRKPKGDMPATTESLCVRNYRKRQAQEERENPKKEYKPSGNRWQGSVTYGSDQFSRKRQTRTSTRLRDITPLERKQHKCHEWIRSEDLIHYKWPAIIKRNPLQNSILIEICCPHFGPVRVMGNTLCHPHCRSCRNGQCIAPEVCQCHDGFVLTDNNDCVFTCPISCLNGRCNLLTRGCLCNSGHILDKSGEFCRPICRAGCGMNPLHNCTAPEICGCVRGFSLTDNDCQPIAPTRGSWGRRH